MIRKFKTYSCHYSNQNLNEWNTKKTLITCKPSPLIRYSSLVSLRWTLSWSVGIIPSVWTCSMIIVMIVIPVFPMTQGASALIAGLSLFFVPPVQYVHSVRSCRKTTFVDSRAVWRQKTSDWIKKRVDGHTFLYMRTSARKAALRICAFWVDRGMSTKAPVTCCILIDQMCVLRPTAFSKILNLHNLRK